MSSVIWLWTMNVFVILYLLVYMQTYHLNFQKIITSNRNPCGLKKTSLSTRWKGFWSGSRSVLNGFFNAWQSPFRGLKKEELGRMTDHTIGAMDIYGQNRSTGNTKSTRQCGTLQQNTVSCWLKTLWFFFTKIPKIVIFERKYLLKASFGVSMLKFHCTWPIVTRSLPSFWSLQ